MFRRIGFFLLVNIGVIATISVITSLLGVGRYLTPYGIDVGALIGFCAVWGVAGSVISLLISRWMAVKAYGVRVIERAETAEEKQLVHEVEKLSRRAGIPMPQVGVYESPEVNAFATGPSKSKSLLAVSTGLLAAADEKALSAILGHEVAHIANGDMVTLTLIQGVVNAFTMFFARIAAFVVARALGDREGEMSQMTYMLCVFVFDIVFSVLGSVVVFYFSRQREYRADAGGAKYTSTTDMVHALTFLQKRFEPVAVHTEEKPFRAMMIADSPSSIAELFSTHPPLVKRIAALRR